MKQISLSPLTTDRIVDAMMLVTESFDKEVVEGKRAVDYEEDWMHEHKSILSVADGSRYAGLVGYIDKIPVALTVISESPAYEDGTGIFDWFYVSPSIRASTFPMRLARSAIHEGKKRGLTDIVAYVGWGNEKITKVLEHVGMEPYEVEYRGNVEGLTGFMKRAPLPEGVVSNNGNV